MKLEIIYVRVGNTRSGKVIPYTSSVEDLGFIVQYFKESAFSADDLLDALAVFSYLAVRGIRRGEKTEIFDRHAEGIQRVSDLKAINKAKDFLNIKSAFDLRDLGKSLVSVEFADF